jgi:hypothetical protein
MPKEQENFPGGFHQVFNGKFRATFPEVPVNDPEAWRLHIIDHPEAVEELRDILVESYVIVLERYTQGGQAASQRFINEAKSEYDRLRLPGSDGG